MEGIEVTQIAKTVTALISTWGVRVVGALVLLVVGWCLARIIRSWTGAALKRARLDETLVPFMSHIAYYAALTFVIIAVLGLFGVQTTSFVAVLGATGFAVGLALQGTLSNFSAGVMLLVFRPFGIGDYVDVGGTTGTVQEIGIFTTTLNTPDNVRILVPNSTIYGQTIKNYSANDTRRVDLVVGISYDDDIGTAVDAVSEIVKSDERVLEDPAPTIAVCDLGSSSVDIVVRPWCNTEDYWTLRFDLTRALKEGVEKAGCSFPYPQRDVHMYSEAK